MSDETDDGLPRVLAIAWGMYAAPNRGPKRELSHEGILDVAIEIADTSGLGAVTMQRVAEALGYTTMSLYRYVTSKGELITLMQDHVLLSPEVLPVDAADWRVGLRDFTAELRRVYRAHPWLLDVAMSTTTVLMPNNMKYADAGLRAMRTLPLDESERQATLLVLLMFVRTFAVLERDLDHTDAAQVYTDAAVELLRTAVTAERFPDLAPAVLSGAYVGPAAPAGAEVGDDFDFGLARLIDGLDAYVARRPDPRDASSQSAAADDPAARLARAESELAVLTAQRKSAQARLKDLERRESQANRERDRARAAAKR